MRWSRLRLRHIWPFVLIWIAAPMPLYLWAVIALIHFR